MEHNRPEGLGQGYYCPRCGVPGLSVLGSRDHGIGICLPDPYLVARLDVLNGKNSSSFQADAPEARAKVLSQHPDRGRLPGRPPCEETLRLVGVTGDEWWFVQGRYEEARDELAKLRLGVTRVAQATGNREVAAAIPAADAERGWNALCGFLCEHVQLLRRENEGLRSSLAEVGAKRARQRFAALAAGRKK